MPDLKKLGCLHSRPLLGGAAHLFGRGVSFSVSFRDLAHTQNIEQTSRQLRKCHIAVQIMPAAPQYGKLSDAPASTGSFSGSEIIRAMMGDVTVHIDAMIRVQLASTAEDAFQKIFTIAAAIAFGSFLLELFVKDEYLGDAPAGVV